MGAHCSEVEAMVDQKTIQDIAKVIATHLRPRRIILFGSYARGKAEPHNDLDLFVEMDPPLPAGGRARQIKQLFDPYPCPMDIVVYSPAEVAYWKQALASLAASVLREGKVLYERS
jgi:predicted nucleotidyltransferase